VLVGVVCDDLDAALAYREMSTGGCVMIRGVADVPAELGGFAVLSPALMTPELEAALDRATSAPGPSAPA
jgi:hypothetical protein